MKTNFKTRGRASLAFGLLCMSLTACGLAPKTYHAEPIRIQVVDSVTKEPIAGAMVVARWAATTPNLEGSSWAGNVEILVPTPEI